MTFGEAIEKMKHGSSANRKGWNGKGIFVYLTFGGCDTLDRRGRVDLGSFIAIDTTGLQTDNPDAPKSVVPWLASQTDMLADDWEVVE